VDISAGFDDAHVSAQPGEIWHWRMGLQGGLAEGKHLLCKLQVLFISSAHPDPTGLSIIRSQVFELTTEIQLAVSCVCTMLIYLTGC
jgi:hypothetical protein